MTKNQFVAEAIYLLSVREQGGGFKDVRGVYKYSYTKSSPSLAVPDKVIHKFEDVIHDVLVSFNDDDVRGAKLLRL